MRELLQENTLLLLFLVSAIGYSIGNIEFRKTGLGVAAVLFTGLVFGGLDSNFHIPEIIILLGLSMFVYSIGLSSGPAFFQSFKKRGGSNLTFVMAFVIVSSVVITLIHYIFTLDNISSASIYAGGFTNTPALAALLDVLTNNHENGVLESLQKRAVIGYSLTYPMGVIGVIVAFVTAMKLMHIDFQAEEKTLKKIFPIKQVIDNQVVLITNAEVFGKEIREVKQMHSNKMVFGRIERNGERILSNYDTLLLENDKALVVADEDDLEEIAQFLGEKTEIVTSIENQEYAERQIFLSNRDIAGEKLASININQKFSAIITRITRGDMDLLATDDTVIELGDRIRILGRRRDIPKIRELFGDSYEALSHINLLSFGLGLALGLALGMVDFVLPGGVVFNLGYAGGPLLVALILGNLRRTGSIVWALPYSANLTIQQIGLTLLLAGIGVNSGNAFFATLATPEGIKIFAAGALMTYLTVLLLLIIGYKVLNIPFSLLMGMTASQPAILDFAIRKTGNKLPTIGYTTMLPVLLILKLLVVQLLFAFL